MPTTRVLGTLATGATALACAALVLATGATAAGAAPDSSAPDTTAPPTPLHFLVNGVTATGVSMQWAPGLLTEPTAWRVYRNGSLIATRLGSAFGDRNLAPGATYSYHVVAVDAAGNTAAPTRTITVTTRGPGVSPGAPSNLRLTAVAPARVTLEFDRPGDEFDVSRYRVFDGDVEVGFAEKQPYAGATASVDVRRLTPGTAHAYTVRADRFGFGLSASSNGVAVTLPGTTDAQPPTAPTGLVASQSRYSCDFADLQWTQSTDNADGSAAIDYEVFTNGVFHHFVRGTGQTRSIQFFSHGTHAVTVRAVDSSGNASAHSSATFTIDPFCQLEG